MAVPTPHITAKKEEIAKTVLMPGDPKRSAFIAKNYFKHNKRRRVCRLAFCDIPLFLHSV